jgi:hypothetical protein
MNQANPVEPSEPAPPPDFVAWDTSGDLARADGATGAVQQTVAAAATNDRDLAWDPWAKRVVLYQGNEDEGGEIAAHPLDDVLGARAHVAWIDGRARLLPAPAGLVVFEESYGERWKLLGSTPTASVIAPPPASAWLTVDAQGATLHALSYDGDALARREATVAPTGIAAPSIEPLSIAPATLPPTARLVPALGDTLLVDVDGDALAVRRADGSASFVPLPASGMRIEAAAALRDGRVVALLLSGAEAMLAAVAVDTARAVSSAAHLPLPGVVAPAPRFFGRDLATQGDARVLAATSVGIHAVDVLLDDAAGVRLELAAGFDGSTLRGPIAVIDPPP